MFLRVINRNNESEEMSFDEINNRIKVLANFTNDEYAKNPLLVNTSQITLETISKLFDGITTRQLDIESAKVCATLESLHYNYGILGGRILASDHQKHLAKQNLNSFSSRMNYINQSMPNFFNQSYVEFINSNITQLDSFIDKDRDYLLNYFGFKTLEKSYLIKVNDEPIETPQDMFLRVAISIHFRSTYINLDKILESIFNTYDLTSKGYFTHATPTLFNAGTRYEQMSSCYLLGTEDSLEGIFKTISDTAQISKWAGGIGVHISNIRGKGSRIKSTNGKSDGIIPMLKIYNETARYANQCFTPDTWIYTKDGPKQMSNVTINDELITFDGSYRNVNEVIITQISKEILKIKTYTSLSDITLTSEHDIFCIKNIHKHTNDKIYRLLKDKINLPCFIPASDIGIDDFIGYPIPKYEIDTEETFDFLLVENNPNYKLDNQIIHLPYTKLFNILKSLLTSEFFDTNTFIFKHSSIQLLIQIKYILLRFDILTISIDNQMIQIPKDPILFTIFDFDVNTEYKQNYFKWNNILWCRIKSIEKINYTGPVYDFNMIDHHNYLTVDLGLVHNSGKRKGSVAIYLEPWHIDILGFLDLKKNTGAETERTRDLFTALWIPDEFMRRVQADEDWYLMCPSECEHLTDTYDKIDSKDFTLLYNKYIIMNKYRYVVKARDIFNKIMESQVETGVPYILFKDNINRKSNQSNIGIIKSSNLCAEITEVSSSAEYAVCNLGSIAVNRFINKVELDKMNTFEVFKSYIKSDNLTMKNISDLQQILRSIYDFDKLKLISKNLTLNLNNIIDYNYYPTNETRISNLNNRPIGIGIQGLGDLYYILNIPYSSYVAKYLDSLIMETIYYGSIEESSNITTYKGSYSSYTGSSFSMGEFQFDLWLKESNLNLNIYPQMHNWNELRQKVIENGMANSLLTALMPTASTSQILGNNECFEPYSSNIYKRTTLAGQFQVVNRHLVDKLIGYNVWNDEIRKNIIINDGSIQNITINNIHVDELEYLKSVYKTIWEVKQKDVIDHALARGPYVDQSQSMNLFFANPDFKSLYSALVYGWKNGIKTGCYYLRSKPAIEAIKYSVDVKKNTDTNNECTTCSA